MMEIGTKSYKISQTLVQCMLSYMSEFYFSCYLIGITLIFFSLHSYDSLCQRGSELMLVIRLNQLYWKLSLNLQILLDM